MYDASIVLQINGVEFGAYELTNEHRYEDADAAAYQITQAITIADDGEVTIQVTIDATGMMEYRFDNPNDRQAWEIQECLTRWLEAAGSLLANTARN